jgi:hypothetical protein
MACATYFTLLFVAYTTCIYLHQQTNSKPHVSDGINNGVKKDGDTKDDPIATNNIDTNKLEAQSIDDSSKKVWAKHSTYDTY